MLLEVAITKAMTRLLNVAGSRVDNQASMVLILSVCYETPLPSSTENPQHPKRINSVTRKGQQPKEGATPLDKKNSVNRKEGATPLDERERTPEITQNPASRPTPKCAQVTYISLRWKEKSPLVLARKQRSKRQEAVL